MSPIELIAWRGFSANGRTPCAHALPYLAQGGGFVRMTDDQFLNKTEKSVRGYVQLMGVTAHWGNSLGQPISLGRFFAPLSRG